MAGPIPARVGRCRAGYRSPAEGEPHLATDMAWPHTVETWPGKFDPVPGQFAAVVAGLSRFETVRLLVKDAAVAEQAKALLVQANARLERGEFPTFDANDSRIPEYAPIFVTPADGARAAGPV